MDHYPWTMEWPPPATAVWIIAGRDAFAGSQYRSSAFPVKGNPMRTLSFAAGILAGDPARARRFETASRSLGMAFQMQDDLGDLVDQNQDRYGDIKERNPSLPVLLACEKDAVLRARVGQAWREPPVSSEVARALGEAVLDTRAVDQTLDAILRDVEEARKALHADAGHPSVDLIWQFADSLLADPRRARSK